MKKNRVMEWRLQVSITLDWQGIAFSFIVLFCGIGICNFPQRVSASESMHRAADIKNLQRVEAAKNIPVELTGIVTCIPEGWKGFFVQDDSGGIYCEAKDLESEESFWPVKLGEEIHLVGVSAPGSVNSFIFVERVLTRSAGKLPPARECTLREVLDRGVDADFVKVRGYIADTFQVASQMEYDLTNEGLDIQVAHAGFRVDPVTPDHTLVEVSGVVLPLRNDPVHAYRMIVPSSEYYQVIETVDEVHDRIPTVNLKQVLEEAPNRFGPFVKFTANVFYAGDRNILLVDQGAGIEWKRPRTIETEIDQRVEVVAAISLEGGRRILKHGALIREANDLKQLERSARNANVDYSKASSYHLEAIQAGFLYRNVDETGQLLIFEKEGGLIKVRMPLKPMTSETSRMSPRGLYKITGLSLPSGDANAKSELFVRNPEDIELVAAPPWTMKETLLVVSFLSAGLSLGLAVAIASYHQLKQTKSSLELARAALRQTNEQLESTVDKRTLELRLTNEKLLLEAEIRRRAEFDRAKTQSKLDEVMSIAQLGAYYWDAATDSAIWSEQSYKIHGLASDTKAPSVEEYLKLLHPEDREGFVRHLEKIMSSSDRLETRYRILTNDSTECWVSTIARATLDKDNKVLAIEGTFQDISERVKVEEQLRQSLKMDALGRLAGGIAHDLNNTLTVIQISCHMLQAFATLEETALNQIDTIQSATERSARLTKQLLTYSRKQIQRPVIININQSINSFLPLLNRLIGDNIQLVAKLDTKLRKTRIDPSHFEQILMNLIVNASDAQANQGSIHISTKNCTVNHAMSKELWELNPSTGEHVSMTISDHGHGIASEALKHIFEPFFTTKTQDKGTGLGLAVVHGILKQIGGGLRVKSVLNQGTTFEILFPAMSDGDLASSGSQPDLLAENQSLPKGHNESILLVDDEASVLQQTKLILEHLGYQVTTANSAIAASKALNEAERKFDLLLTDYSMPNMNGAQLARKLREVDPDLAVVFMSGYLNEEAFQSQLQDAEQVYIQKPFSITSLGIAIRDSLKK